MSRYIPDVTSLPPPVLFNAWKHHAAFLRETVRHAAQHREPGLRDLCERLKVIGADLMDLYVGPLSLADISRRVIGHLGQAGCLEPESYRAWLASQQGFAVVEFDNHSRWVFRAGNDPERYVHVHPGRWSPGTRRVRANVLKTAVLVLAHTECHGGDARDISVINIVRKQLALAPINKRAGESGLGAVIDLLKSR